MYRIIQALHDSELFSDITIVELIDEEQVRLLKVKAILNDGSLLYITELHTSDYQKYSYHWQKTNGELLIRWDNKSHWKQLATFPDHKHEGGNVHPSPRVSIDDVLLEIKKKYNS